MLKVPVKIVRIGSDDDGRRMSLDRFDKAIGRNGFLYELSRGVVEVTDVPPPRHLAQVQAVRNQLVLYQESHPEIVHTVTGSNENKILLGLEQSERHPDVSVYLSPPPDVDDVWSLWVPAIVVEVVSPKSGQRDYQDKYEEYLSFGIDEYWIVDSARQQMTANVRWRGQWKPSVLEPTQKYSTRQLPGFSLDLKRVFAAAKA